MANRTVLQPDWPWIKKFGFAPGIRTGDTIYTCGVIAFDRDGNVVGDGDCYAQTVQTFANIRELLATEGATMEDVVKITAFLPDMSRYKEYAKARKTYRAVLKDVLAAHYPNGGDDVDEQCREVLRLLG